MNNKVYIIEEKNDVYKSSLFEFILGIFVYALILLIVNNVFKGFYVNGFLWALIAALIISFFNSTIKPFLIFIFSPLTLVTLGLAYPVVNLVILKLTSLLLGENFVVEGFWVPFIISIFISILRILFDAFIVKPMIRRVK